MMNKDKYFYCYSIKLFHFLKLKKFRYICKGFNERTNKNYWVFERDESLLNALTEYDQVRNFLH